MLFCKAKIRYNDRYLFASLANIINYCKNILSLQSKNKIIIPFIAHIISKIDII